MRERHHMLPVWFFIGLLLSAYGIIILVTSITGWSRPSSAVLSQYHPGVWGGIVLLVIGCIYVLQFRPRPPRGK
jgi:hypothetical protein